MANHVKLLYVPLRGVLGAILGGGSMGFQRGGEDSQGEDAHVGHFGVRKQGESHGDTLRRFEFKYPKSEKMKPKMYNHPGAFENGRVLHWIGRLSMYTRSSIL